MLYFNVLLAGLNFASKVFREITDIPKFFV